MGSTGASLTYQVLKDHIDLSNLFGSFNVLKSSPRAVTPVLQIDEKSIRWEELPLAAGSECQPAGGGIADVDGVAINIADAKREREPATFQQKCYKGLKILLPHIGLTVLLLSYIAGGAGVLILLESSPEISRRTEKLENVTRLYGIIYEVGYNACINARQRLDLESIQSKMRPFLEELSMVHEYDDRFSKEDQLWSHDKTKLKSRWTFQAAVLYSLTVVTTTGYDHVSPLTDGGRLFAVFFGLVGIPLMFITAADIGKFLSEVVTGSYARCVQFYRFLVRKLLARLRRRRPPSTSLNGGAGLATATATAPTAGDCEQPAKTDGERKTEDMDDPLFALENAHLDERVELPVFAYFGLILGYCAIGGLLFTSFEMGPIWSFVHGFFFSFNTITTIGLGNVLVHNGMYLVLIVIYCIVGLAVITMCVDLASAQLKVLFTKLHYFGRKIRGARSTFLTMSDDIREAIRIIAALKRSRPSKGSFTLEDIKQFLEIEQQFMARPFIPRNIHFIKWADEEDGSVSLRSNSFSSPCPPPSAAPQAPSTPSFRDAASRQLLHDPSRAASRLGVPTSDHSNAGLHH